MTEISLTRQFEQLFEPAARAARRGDPEQIRKVLASVRTIWKRFRKHKKGDAAEAVAQGMTFAIEGILGIVLASAGADARHTLLEGRKHALPVLHALGKKARADARNPSAANGALQMGELAKAVGVRPQNLGELVEAMSRCGLVRVTGQGSARPVTITEIGAQMLESAKPGWQLMNVEQDFVIERLEESLGQAIEQFEALEQAEEPYGLDTVGNLCAYATTGVALAKLGSVVVTTKEFPARHWRTHFDTARYSGLEPFPEVSGGSDADRAHELERLTRVGAMRRGIKAGGIP